MIPAPFLRPQLHCPLSSSKIPLKKIFQGGRNGEMLVKGYKLPVIRCLIPSIRWVAQWLWLITLCCVLLNVANGVLNGKYVR